MKQIKYLFVVLSALIMNACSTDQTTSPLDTPESRAFSALTRIGIYQNNLPLHTFNKITQQLVITPATRTIRIQDDAGDKYAELTLSAIPTSTQSVEGSLRSNLNIPSMPNAQLDGILLLQAKDGTLWLWCEKNKMGFILPWME